MGGLASLAAWSGAQPLIWAGGTLSTVALLLWGAQQFLKSDIGLSLLRGDGSVDLYVARSRLIEAISETELLAQVRTFINTERQGRFGHAYTVSGSPGLSEIYNEADRVPTSTAVELEGLLGRFDGASVGVAGPRGSGKSTLIREYCEEVNPHRDYSVVTWSQLFGSYIPRRVPNDLRCMVAAPVDYVARDFVLHLFAAFCRAVIANYSIDPNEPSSVLNIFWARRFIQLLASFLLRCLICGAAVGLLLYAEHFPKTSISIPEAWTQLIIVSLICVGTLGFAPSSASRIRSWERDLRNDEDEVLAAAARNHLSRVRYLQTYTSGWSGSLSLPTRSVVGQHSRSLSQIEQPRSYPEIVDDFRNFARDAARKVHNENYRVFIGVDELDKIGSAEQAEQFLNEIKGIFGIPHVYFMVSVSDDALTAFERRGLPLRDAFDSSFDEILDVGPLSYTESRRLLYRRVIGLSEPYVALCHCLAGGLARDLIRAARLVVRTASLIETTSSAANSDDAETIDVPTTYLRFGDESTNQPTLGSISAAIVQDELRRKLRALRHVLAKTEPGSATELQATLHNVAPELEPNKAIIDIVDLISESDPEEPRTVSALRLDFATYAYYCATLQEVFSDRLDNEHMIEATADSTNPGNFDALAAARNAFAADTSLAWNLITQFRHAWSLDVRSNPTTSSATAKQPRRSRRPRRSRTHAAEPCDPTIDVRRMSGS